MLGKEPAFRKSLGQAIDRPWSGREPVREKRWESGTPNLEATTSPEQSLQQKAIMIEDQDSRRR